jgi:hypothetical protein
METYTPSQDGKLYLQQGFETVSKGLEAAGFKYVVPNDHPDQKNHTYGHSTFFIENAERHGPLVISRASKSSVQKVVLLAQVTLASLKSHPALVV